jgi:tetratricopeptide (TPR) repeat protein/GGDEF domain-containing protein
MLIPFYSSAVRLTPQDFSLFRGEFTREIEKILPVSATPVFWSTLGQKALPGLGEEQAAQVLPQLQDICAGGEPGRVQDLLVLPLPVADGERIAVILQGIDPGLSRKMAQEWLAMIRDQLRTSLELIKQAHIHPETGLYTSRLLYGQLAEVPAAPASLFLVGATYRAGSSSAGLQQLVQAARLLENLAPGTVYYLGGNLFGVLQDNMGREGALHFARRLLGRMKREGLRTVHIGIGVRGEPGSAEENGSWFAECWQALEMAERRGPFSLCESSPLRQRHAHPLARPAGEVTRQLRRGWRGSDRFGLLLFRGEEGGVPMDLAASLKGLLGSSEVLAPATPGEAYVLLPGASPQEALRRGHALKKMMDRSAGAGRVALGISTWPSLNYARTETAVNCRKALLHGRFLGPGAVTVFDHVSLNVSGDHFFDEGDYRQAVRDYQAGLRMNGGDVNLMNSLGVTLAELNRQQQAVNAFDRVLAREPGNYMALVNKSFAQRMLGRQDEALACFEQVARQPGFSKSSAFADISLQLGRLYCSTGRYREALNVLEKLEKLGSERQGFHLYRLLGEAYAGIGKNAEAMRSLQRAIRHNPHDAQSLSILGELYAREEQGDDIALSLCLQAVALDDKPAGYWCRLARVREKMGEVDGALAAVKEALRRNRRDSEGLLLAGRLYRKLGQGKRARAVYRRVVKMVPGQREARRALRELDADERLKKG